MERERHSPPVQLTPIELQELRQRISLVFDHLEAIQPMERREDEGARHPGVIPEKPGDRSTD